MGRVLFLLAIEKGYASAPAAKARNSKSSWGKDKTPGSEAKLRRLESVDEIEPAITPEASNEKTAPIPEVGA